jgi:hypothetical protein
MEEALQALQGNRKRPNEVPRVPPSWTHAEAAAADKKLKVTFKSDSASSVDRKSSESIQTTKMPIPTVAAAGNTVSASGDLASPSPVAMLATLLQQLQQQQAWGCFVDTSFAYFCCSQASPVCFLLLICFNQGVREDDARCRRAGEGMCSDFG